MTSFCGKQIAPKSVFWGQIQGPPSCTGRSAISFPSMPCQGVRLRTSTGFYCKYREICVGYGLSANKNSGHLVIHTEPVEIKNLSFIFLVHPEDYKVSGAACCERRLFTVHSPACLYHRKLLCSFLADVLCSFSSWMARGEKQKRSLIQWSTVTVL